MTDKSVRLETESGHTQLVVEVPSGLEATVASAVRELLESAGEKETQDRLLRALIATAEQTYFWTPEWQAGEKEVDEAIQEGRYKTFNSVDDMLDFLDKQ